MLLCGYMCVCGILWGAITRIWSQNAELGGSQDSLAQHNLLLPVPNSPFRMRNKLPILLMLYLAVGWVTAYKTIIDVLSEDKDGRFSQLITHLQRNRLVPRINKLEAATMFAPTDEAFDQLEDGAEITQERLLYHLLPVGMTGQDFFHGQLVESLYVRPGLLGKEDTGQRIKVTKDGKLGKGRGKAYINGADIVDSDVVVNNQTYIQVINKVLEPPPMLGRVFYS